MKGLGDSLSMPMIFLVAAVVGPLGGLLALCIGGSLLRWTGSWIGGAGTSNQIRSAMAWSTVPVIWALILWIPELALFGNELFTSETPVLDSSLPLTLLLVLFGIIEITIGVWALVVFLKCLGEAQGFSAWKALGNGALMLGVILIPIIVLAVAVTAVS
jgi:hypothetical protein